MMLSAFPVILADGIDLPLVLMYGLAILVPLLAFQVVVESVVLSKVWRVEFRSLLHFVFRANVLSLLAGVPTKLLNGLIYGLMLPWNDLYLYFKRYPSAVLVGTFLYFVVTVLVETRRGFVFRRDHGVPISTRRLWLGMVVANFATYIVLAPIHYHFTQPRHDVRAFAPDSSWASQPDVSVRFANPATDEIMVCQLDGSGLREATDEEKAIPDRDESWDECDGWKARALRGLASHLSLRRRAGDQPGESIIVAANGGLMRLSGPYFTRVRFLDGCTECVFEAAEAVYLMDLEERRVGRITGGRDFILLPDSDRTESQDEQQDGSD